jgi:hypothetical protein
MVRALSSFARLRGLRSLVEEAVEHGSKAVEHVHKATAARTFVVLEAIPPIATPARLVHVVHDVSLTSVYGMIRVVNRLVGTMLDVAIDVAEASPSREAPEEKCSHPPSE